MNYELIICNPPYIPAGEIGGLQPELRYEPRAALDGGRDGLAFYRRIIRESPPYLAEEGFLALEIGCGQRKAVEGMLRASGNFRVTDIARDYNHIERVIIARRKKNG